LASADPREERPAPAAPLATDAPGATGAAGTDAASDGEAGKPMLEQRFSPWLTVRTTLHQQGLVVEVSRPFSQRVAAVDFDRLVLEPAAVTTPRRDVAWGAAACFAAGLLGTLPTLRGTVPWIAPALFGLAVLCVVAVAISPRRVTMFLDREQAVHPVFLRGGRDEPQVHAFVDDVRRAAIAWRCRPATPEDEAPARRPSLADALDALLAMREQDLIDDAELARFREMAQRR
jgi:hypothetical protein